MASHERQGLLRHSIGDMRTRKVQGERGSTGRARKLDITEAEEIWGELEDGAGIFVPPSAVGHDSPGGTIEREYSGGNGGLRDSTTMSRVKSEGIRIGERRTSMPRPHRPEPGSSRRSKLPNLRMQKPSIGWWTWQWWRRRPKDGAL